VPGTRHVVIAPDKFKGSLTATQVCSHLVAGLHRYRADVPIRCVPVADGGDGTLDAVTAAGFTLVPATATGPTGQCLSAAFARREGTAVVELAAVSGLRQLPGGRPEPMTSSSRGTGELMRSALRTGCDVLILGLGGSACTDGGAGMVQALGARLLDSNGEELRPGGAGLAGLDTVDLTGLDPALRTTRIVLASDVDNPLTGPAGAAAVYGPQKGADPEQVGRLDAALRHWARVLATATGQDLSGAPGAGAAGGVGFAAMAVLGAQARPGIELVLELGRFDDIVPGAALVITGEGSLDTQSLRGKAPVGVAAAAARHGVPTVAVAGRCTLSARQLRDGGLLAGYALTTLEPDPALCMAEAGALLEELAATVVGPAWLEPAAE
jgi:glycerate 2-kinase